MTLILSSANYIMIFQEIWVFFTLNYSYKGYIYVSLEPVLTTKLMEMSNWKIIGEGWFEKWNMLMEIIVGLLVRS